MLAVVQRVSQASVSVDGSVISRIGKGLCVLVGIGESDTKEDMEKLAQKLVNIRLWPDQEKKAWKNNVTDIDGEILLISQFTLFGKLKGSKPSFHKAMKAEAACEFFNKFVEHVESLYQSDRVQTGEFQAMMQVELCNDGPVTLTLDTRETK